MKENMSSRRRHGTKVARYSTHQRVKVEAKRLRSARKIKLRQEVHKQEV